MDDFQQLVSPFRDGGGAQRGFVSDVSFTASLSLLSQSYKKKANIFSIGLDEYLLFSFLFSALLRDPSRKVMCAVLLQHLAYSLSGMSYERMA